MHFEIKLPLFEGPFDLLLFFIERDEIDIYDIPIYTITTDFLAYLKQIEQLNLDVSSEFILVAATLMRIKAKMLLPRPILNEQGQEIDPRQDLVNHLLAYKKYKVVAEELATLEITRSTYEQRGNILEEIKRLGTTADNEAELQDLDLYKLLTIYKKVLNRFSENSQKHVHQIVPYPYTIEGQRNFILELVEQKETVTFIEVYQHYNRTEHTQLRIVMIFNFLAILDLLQAGAIQLASIEGVNNFVLTKKVLTVAQDEAILVAIAP